MWLQKQQTEREVASGLQVKIPQTQHHEIGNGQPPKSLYCQ